MTTTRTVERTDFLANVLVTAIESGIGYWAEVKDYKWSENGDHNMVDARAKVRGDSKSGAERDFWHDVTLDTIEEGIAVLKQMDWNRSHKAFLLLADNENEAGDIDSEIADCIVQAALYGVLKYG